MALRDGQATLDTIGFGFGAYAKEISPVAKVSVIGEASINEWNNFKKPQLMVQDIAVERGNYLIGVVRVMQKQI